MSLRYTTPAPYSGSFLNLWDTKGRGLNATQGGWFCLLLKNTPSNTGSLAARPDVVFIRLGGCPFWALASHLTGAQYPHSPFPWSSGQGWGHGRQGKYRFKKALRILNDHLDQ